MGKVVGLFTCPAQGQPMVSHELVSIIAGRGIVGDRYFLGTGFFSQVRLGTVREITIISAEAIRLGNADLMASGQQPFAPEQTRRNAVVECDPELLNSQVGRVFTLGGRRFRGAELATPCFRPPQLLGRTEKGFKSAFEGRGGIRAAGLDDGILRLGDLFSEL